MAWAASEPLKVEEVEVAPPQKGEVRVKVIANALVGVMNEKKYTLFLSLVRFSWRPTYIKRCHLVVPLPFRTGTTVHALFCLLSSIEGLFLL